MAAVLAQTAARPVQAPCKSRRTAVRVAALQQGALSVGNGAAGSSTGWGPLPSAGQGSSGARCPRLGIGQHARGPTNAPPHRLLPLPTTTPVPADAAAPAVPLRFLAAGLAAAALATATPAQAGVVLVQPEVKNFVKDTPAAPAASGAAKAAPAAKKAAPKREESGSPGAGFEAFRPAVLPLSVLAIAGAGAAAVKADPEFAKLLDESWGAKNSNAIGAGYETAPGLKVGDGRGVEERRQMLQGGSGAATLAAQGQPAVHPTSAPMVLGLCELRHAC